MFYENSTHTEFSFESGLPASSAESETRHLVNRLRLEFRTASQRQLEEAVSAALEATTARSAEKILQLARAGLEQILTPTLERTLEQSESTASEPPFRTETKTGGINVSPAA